MQASVDQLPTSSELNISHAKIHSPFVHVPTQLLN